MPSAGALVRPLWRAAAPGADTPPLAARSVAGHFLQKSHEFKGFFAENGV